MTDPDAPIAWPELLLRLLWVVVRIVVAAWLAQQGAYFVYQGF